MEVFRKLNTNLLRPCDEHRFDPEEVIIRKRGRRQSTSTSGSEAQADFAAAALLILETRPGPLLLAEDHPGGKRSREDSESVDDSLDEPEPRGFCRHQTPTKAADLAESPAKQEDKNQEEKEEELSTPAKAKDVTSKSSLVTPELISSSSRSVRAGSLLTGKAATIAAHFTKRPTSSSYLLTMSARKQSSSSSLTRNNNNNNSNSRFGCSSSCCKVFKSSKSPAALSFSSSFSSSASLRSASNSKLKKTPTTSMSLRSQVLSPSNATSPLNPRRRLCF